MALEHYIVLSTI